MSIDASSDVSAKDNDGTTSLVIAAENVLPLLEAGTDLTVRDKEGETALSLARKSEQVEIVKLLESRGAPE